MARKNQLVDDICQILDCQATFYQKKKIRDLIYAHFKDRAAALRDKEQEIIAAEGKRLFKRTIEDLNHLPADVRAEVLQNLCAVNFY